MRKYFLVLIATSLDYEEVVLITGVKSGQHYYRCQVVPNKQEELLKD